LLLAFVAHGGGAVPSSLADSIVYIALAVPSELLLGAAMGLVVRITTSISEITGDAISPLFGLGAAAVFDPQVNSSVTPLTRLLNLLVLSLAMAAGAHRVVIGAMLTSFRAIPPGYVVDVNLAVPALVRLCATTLEVGVRVALPVLAVLLLTQVALAFVSRAAPTMQIFSIGFAVSIMVGCVTFIVALPDMARAMLEDILQIGPRLAGLIAALAG